MRYRAYESSSPKRILTYFLYVMCVFWSIITLILGYQFLSENGEKINKKWGTLSKPSLIKPPIFLILKMTDRVCFISLFCLMPCTNYNLLNEEGLKGEHCKIITQDYQTYYVSVNGTGKTRSDGKIRWLEDLLFTYDQVIRQNIWGIKTLTTYEGIKIEPEKEKNRLKITFPTSTTDNNYFSPFLSSQNIFLETQNLMIIPAFLQQTLSQADVESWFPNPWYPKPRFQSCTMWRYQSRLLPNKKLFWFWKFF